MCCYANGTFSYHNRSSEISIRLNNSKNVQGFSSTNKEIFYIPKELNSFFPGMKFLQITNAKLKEISKEDLEIFINLEILDLSQNEIKVLEADLFEFNLKLKDIDLNQNSIELVDPTTFDGPKNLKSLIFYKNVCYSKLDEHLSVELKLVRIISHCCNKTNCASNYYMEYFIKNMRTERDEMIAEIEKISMKNSFFQYPVGILVFLNTLALFAIAFGYFYNSRQLNHSSTSENTKSIIYVAQNDSNNQNKYEKQHEYEVIEEPQYDANLFDKISENETAIDDDAYIEMNKS